MPIESQFEELFRVAGDPLLSVGIPAFDSVSISWLPFLALSRQEKVPVPWEIVICQEDDSVSKSVVEEYRESLISAGCVRVVLVQLKEWIHLSRKWITIRDHLAESSEVFLLQGVDDYPHVTRLASSWSVLQDGTVDWFHWDDMLFYDCNFENWTIFKGAEKPPLTPPKMGWSHHPCNPNMATRTEYLNHLPEQDVRRGVDGWIFYSIQQGIGRKPTIKSGEPDEQLTGFGTTGFNSLSLSRIKQGQDPKPPMFPYDGSLDAILPGASADRIRNLGDESRKRALPILISELARYESKLERIRNLFQKNHFLRVLSRPVFSIGKKILNLS